MDILRHGASPVYKELWTMGLLRDGEMVFPRDMPPTTNYLILEVRPEIIYIHVKSVTVCVFNIIKKKIHKFESKGSLWGELGG